MILLFTGIGVLTLVVGIIVYIVCGVHLSLTHREWIYWTLNVTGGTLAGIFLVVAFILGVSYSERMIIDDKIALYKEENAKIEEQITEIVESYKDYESDTFEKLKYDDLTVLVSLYPELKSNELVAQQINIYINNNAQIKRLECERLDYKVQAWWLFFGD